MIQAVVISNPSQIEIHILREAPVRLELFQFNGPSDPYPKPLVLRSNTFYADNGNSFLVYWPVEWPSTLGMVTLYTWMMRQKMGISYSVNELQRLLAMAKQLGFQDDIDHWSGLLGEES